MKKVIEKFMLMVEKLSNTTKTSRPYNTDVDIYRTEIHIITLIGDYTELYVSEIARKFGVTKGAVSQVLKKLEKKGLVQKFQDETNNTRMLVRLTAKGQIAYQSHEDYHRQYDQELFTFLESLDERSLDAITTFIDKVNEMTENHL